MSQSYFRKEPSTTQVIKPIHASSLTDWVGTFSEELQRKMPDVAPMLQQLGYDPRANPPNYGQPDKIVVENTKNITKNAKLWQQKAQEYRHGINMKEVMQLYAELRREQNEQKAQGLEAKI